MKLTYRQMADTLDIPYCAGMQRNGQYCPYLHKQQGMTADGTIHFADRQVKRAETFAFLKLAAIAYEPTLNDDVPWRRVYRRSRVVNELGKRLHFAPGRLWRFDKAFVLAGTAGLSNEVEMRKQAFDWARR